ncbi:MAG: hypothetical protein Ct9H300mP14_11000 [Gammaproteobacteria bacterium]|nr:MAG: hypothetical protein Ct9H300mP14_11000 [Gammaproteobacteria bacterium]
METKDTFSSAVSSEVIISLRNVNKYFGDFQALKGVDLDVHTGERIVIWGLLDRESPRLFVASIDSKNINKVTSR